MRPFLAFLVLLFGAQSASTYPPIGIIDFYGLRTVPVNQARAALGIKEGDSLPAPDAEIESFGKAAEQRLEKLPGVRRAKLNFVCCEAGKAILYVGVEEAGAPLIAFRATPTGKVRLPQEITRAGDAFQKAFEQAILRGDTAEDDSRGYSLNHDPTTRQVQERFPGFAAHELNLLRRVLRTSSDAGNRALAAQILGYAPDKQAVVPDLVTAMRDPDGNVRNNAMRALWVFGGYAQAHPEAKLRVPPAPFVELLNSLDWTDRNKSSLALLVLTEHHDPTILEELRAHAIPALADMARWKAPGHAEAGFFLLGRVAGIPETEIKAAWTKGDHAAFICAAVANLKTG